jgi:hypothetical protein
MPYSVGETIVSKDLDSEATKTDINVADNIGLKVNIPNTDMKLKHDVKSSISNTTTDLPYIYLSNGDSPWSSCIDVGVPFYDQDSPCYLTVRSPKDVDVLILLKDVETGRIIRNEYIQKSSEFNFSSMPIGRYILYYYSGIGWLASINSPIGCRGGFNSGSMFSRADEFLEFEFGPSGQYTAISITLYGVANGNMQSREVRNPLEIISK